MADVSGRLRILTIAYRKKDFNSFLKEVLKKMKNLTVEDAAKAIGKTPQFVRVGLQQQRLPFGTAVKMPGGRWSYSISSELLKQYAGEEVERVDS